MKEHIEKKVLESFNCSRLEVIDISHLHAGHNNFTGSKGTHFKLNIISKDFDGMNLVARHRAVKKILAEELAGQVHALELVTKTD